MATWERARDETQKRERREAILSAARRLLDEQGGLDVSLNAIARAVGLSKSNLYRYFESREEILLHLFLQDHEQWVTQIERALAPLAGSSKPRKIAAAVVRETTQMPRLGLLGANLASVLERNISESSVVRFKLALSDASLRFCNALVVAAPRLPVARARAVLDGFYALAAGLWPMCTPSANVCAALAHPEISHLAHDFERDCTEAFALMLTGALVENEDERGRGKGR